MKTVFAAFSAWEDARAADDDLLNRGFPEEETNAIAQEDVAKEHMELRMKRVNPEPTETVSRVNVYGLDRLLAGEHPIRTPDAGNVFAGGVLATEIAKVGAIGGPTSGLQGSLVDFDIPPDVAGAYVDTIKGGGVLLFLRTADERAPEAGEVMRARKGMYIGAYPRQQSMAA